jgi:hypothetical protein
LNKKAIKMEHRASKEANKASKEVSKASGKTRLTSKEARRKGWRRDGERVRKRRRRLPFPMKAGEGSLFRGERTERIGC